MIRLFFSYSHADEDLRDQLEKQLALLKRQSVVETWHDRRIAAGTEIESAIDREIDEADVILLLVSSDFMASDYCYGREMNRAMERHEAGSATVMPVILRPCDWHGAPFGKLMATPRDGKAITLWPDRDEALLDVTQAIRRVSDKRLSRSERPRHHPSGRLLRELRAALKIARQKYIYNRRFNSSYRSIVGNYGMDAVIELAENGDADAISFMMRSIYSDFSDEGDDTRHASYLSYVMMLAELDDPEGLVALATQYSGDTLEKDPKKSLSLIRKAMEMDHPEAFLRMGYAYEYELYGLKFDLEEALDMYRSASERGSVEGTFQLGKLLRRVNDESMAEEGKALIRRAADEKLIEATMELAFSTIVKHYQFRDSAVIMRMLGEDITEEGRAMLRPLLNDPDLERYPRSRIEEWLEPAPDEDED
jgi:nucleotide-binding universal stress UspA family protein